MIRYTVTYTREAQDDLARIWMQSRDRGAVTSAGDEIDRVLRRDAPQKGSAAVYGVRQLIVTPLVAEFTVIEADRIVTVSSVRHVGELTNGS